MLGFYQDRALVRVVEEVLHHQHRRLALDRHEPRRRHRPRISRLEGVALVALAPPREIDGAVGRRVPDARSARRRAGGRQALQFLHLSQIQSSFLAQ